ncbi:hypothetical protein ACFQFH_17435 [Halobaculum halobium]|uniref:hypothetical protein n=1 Tax=Halobaculum halobium TaxID=3032281 RepID=UPI003620F88C
MATSHDARVLVAVSDQTPSDYGADVVGALEASLNATVLSKRGSVATEYLRELGPTLDCVVVVSDRTVCVENLASVADEVPLLVYGDEVPAVPVDEVIATDGGRTCSRAASRRASSASVSATPSRRRTRSCPRSTPTPAS